MDKHDIEDEVLFDYLCICLEIEMPYFWGKIQDVEAICVFQQNET